ncbi:MAG: YbdK family carboxylate-amine ligase [Chlamydiia bacterium]|nr:YbdK family carboxylate-amine ligase [Chlamydiia bacterium]
MPVLFEGSQEPTLGVEVEFQILDPKSCTAVSKAKQVLERCRQRQIGRVKAEIHQSMIEVDTEISQNVKECRRHLEQRIQQLQGVFNELNLMIGATATHPFHRWVDNEVFPNKRYLYVSEKFQWLAKRVTVYGMHVHVGVPSGDAVLAVMNKSLPYLPHLLALSSNSPYWQGIDTGMSSCRIGIMDSFPYAGIPCRFDSWEEFSLYYNTLKETGAVESMKDFYWHVRPNAEFGTVEFRICDMVPTLKETMALVAFIQNLVVWILDDSAFHEDTVDENRLRHWIAPENHWMAERDGLNAMIISPDGRTRVRLADDIFRVVKLLTPIAKRMGNYDEFIYIREMVRIGTGSDRQRRVYQETESFEQVIKAMNAELLEDAPITSKSTPISSASTDQSHPEPF